MKLLLLLGMLTACAAIPQDLSGKMFIFPQQTKTAHVRLTTTKQEFSAITVCHRSFTDLQRDHSLFSMATFYDSNAFLIFWDQSHKEMESHIRDTKSELFGLNYKSNMWHSICTTWDSTTGLVQLWLNGQRSIKKYVNSGSTIRGSTTIVLGQEQDSHGGGFDLKQAFVGMMSDVHMWDYILSPCEIQKYMNGLSFTPGNALNWSALEFQITDRVLIEDKQETCV